MSRGQGKAKLKIVCLGRVIHVFRSDFRQELEKWPLKILNGPNPTKFENRENVEFPGNSVQNGHIWPSKCHKLVILQDIDLTFYTHIQLLGFFQIYSVFFWNFEFFLWKILEIIFFIDYFPKLSKFLKFWKSETAVR